MRRRPVFVALVALAALPRCTWAFAVHLGCFSTGLDNGLALSFKAADSASSMTIEACRALAQARLASTFGLVGGTQCLLDPQGNTTTVLPSSSAAAGSDACSTRCSGDNRVVCGGEQHLSLFLENNPAALTAVPHHAYDPAGCFRDDASARRMTLLWQSPSMSLDLCAHIAFTEQWPVFGLEGGSSCYGAHALEPVKGLGQSGTCTLACAGDASQYCGGASVLNVYTLPSPPWVSTATPLSNQPSALQDSGSSSTGAAPPAQVRSGSVSAGPPRLTALAAAVLGGGVLLWVL